MKNEKVMKALKIVVSICKIMLGVHLLITVWRDIYDEEVEE